MGASAYATDERTDRDPGSRRPPPPEGGRPTGRRAPAYEGAVRQYGNRLLAVARRLLRNEEDARDAVQDAFLSALRSMDRFERRAQLSTWLHRIVVNAALMKLRGRRRRPEEPLDERYSEGGQAAHLVSVGSTEAPDELLERRELCARIRQAIDALPDPYRTVLLLRDIDELDTSETARVLGVSATVVRSRLHRAHRAMRSLLELQPA